MEKVLEKTYKIIETLAQRKEPYGVTELSQQLSLVKSNVHRLLTSLIELGIVQQDKNTGKYQLTLKLWQLGNSVLSHLDYRNLASKHLHQLVARFEEDAYLSVLLGINIAYIDHIKCNRVVRAAMGTGHEAYCSSTGKCIMAWSSEDILLKVMHAPRQYTERTIVDLETMRNELQRVRERGYALNVGEWKNSVRGVGAPIFDHEGRVIAALSLSGPAQRFPLERMEEIGENLVVVARQLSEELGYTPS